MYYGFEISSLPHSVRFYSVTRNTVWQITDRSNIIIFINEGRCRLSSEGEERILKKGGVFFVPKNHSYIRKPVNDELCTMTYIHFDTEELSEYTAEALHKILVEMKNKITTDMLHGENYMAYMSPVFLQGFNNVKNREKIEDIFSEMSACAQKQSVSSGLRMTVYLCEVLAELSKNTIKEILENSDIENIHPVPKKLKRAVGYIMQNYSSQISLDELSRFCHVSKQQLIRYFKTELKTTPLKYITDYKIARAKELLFNYPDLSISEISLELGFDNQHYFSKVFAKATGESPTHYRNRTVYYDDSMQSKQS